MLNLTTDIRNSFKDKTFLELTDGFVHYEIKGEIEKQVTILIPGFSVPCNIWDPLFDFLSESGYTVLRYDLFGRGLSDRPKLNNNIDFFVKQLYELIQTLNIQSPVNIFGVSMGATIGCAFTNLYSNLVDKVCIINPVGLSNKKTFINRFFSLAIIQELSIHLKKETTFIEELKKDFYKSKPFFPRYEKDFKRQMEYTGFKRALISTIKSGILTKMENEYRKLGQLDKKILLIWGKEDTTMPLENTKRLQELMPNAELHIIENAGHLPHYECIDDVSAMISKFLRLI